MVSQEEMNEREQSRVHVKLRGSGGNYYSGNRNNNYDIV